MTTFAFLAFTVIFCALVVMVTNGGKPERVLATVLIGVELYLWMLISDIVGPVISSETSMRHFLSAAATLCGLVLLMRLQDRSFGLLATWAALAQFLLSFGLLRGVGM
jgi:hypothetical protein